MGDSLCDEATLAAWLDGGGDVDAREAENQLTLLLLASFRGRERVVVLLLARGAALDLQASGGATALMAAAMKGHLAVARRLLRAGAGADLASDDGNTALQWAEAEKHSSIVQLLREHAATTAAVEKPTAAPAAEALGAGE